MIRRVPVDTGPLVAVSSGADSRHRVCVETMKDIAPPMPTCWPVVTEAVWLLRRFPTAVQKLLGAFDAGLLEMLPLDSADVRLIAILPDRYRKLGAQLADCALLHLAERERSETIFTLDRRDFSIYRVGRGRALNIIPVR
jgi:hypothetical protein